MNSSLTDGYQNIDQEEVDDDVPVSCSDNVIEDVQNKLQDVRNPIAAMMVLLRELDLETDTEVSAEGPVSSGKTLVISVKTWDMDMGTTDPWSLSNRSESGREDQPVSAVRQQLSRLHRLPGRHTPGHDQSLVLQRPAAAAEALPAPGGQREDTQRHTQRHNFNLC